MPKDGTAGREIVIADLKGLFLCFSLILIGVNTTQLTDPLHLTVSLPFLPDLIIGTGPLES